MQLLYHHFLNQTGYSIAAQEYILAMLSVNPNLNIKSVFFNTYTRIGLSDNLFQLFKSFSEKPLENTFICISHSTPERFKLLKDATKNIGICLFETTGLPVHWIDMMNKMDKIITASDFNRNLFIKEGVTKPIEVIPHCFNPNMFNRDIRGFGRYKQFTFMGLGTWKKRKNWNTLIEAFYHGFSKQDDVCLVIKTDQPHELKITVQDIKKMPQYRGKNTAPIFLEEKSVCTFEEIPKIMSKADVFINTSFGEGFGLPGLHAMALNIPLITVNFGGSTQYAKPELCTLIEPSGFQRIETMDRVPQFYNRIWPIIKMEDVAQQMRYVYENYNEAKTKSDLAYLFVRKRFSYDTIGKLFINALDLGERYETHS